MGTDLNQTQNQRFTLNRDDFAKWGQNMLIFLAPALLVFLGVLQQGQPLKAAFTALYLWALNAAIDLLRKFIANG